MKKGITAAAYYGNDDRNFTRSEVLGILFAAQGATCSICQKFMPRKVATIDHVIPRSMGGRHDFSNWLLAHRECNMAKDNREPADHELARLETVRKRLSVQFEIAASVN